MKKNKIFYSVATAAATLVMTAAPMVPTFAAYTDNKAQSHATFEVTETTTKPDVNIPDTDKPTNGDLQLVAVPNFDFGKVSTSELIAGKTLTVDGMAKNASGAIADDATKSGANNDQNNDKYHLTVSDLRGQDNDWDLTATLSKFTNDADSSSALEGTLNLSSNAKTVTDQYAAGADGNLDTADDAYTQDYLTLADFSALNKSITTGSTETLYSTTNGRGINVAEFSGSTLDLKKSSTAKAGHYTATIDWELKSTAPTEPAGTGTDTGSGN
ncbi:WxL domain-containing protein [Lacticaseibacillus songhuajiangensis]|jgi:hypothetical protein|uniref:WxL domain-containing protein n=1 Tax=Lacticaseibacillus songhuajiangensis TaxID=1296539 RepID=UPI000F794270|nr:WxL domain-containing protein [Lacticaseibacillus songhuajiangensis]